MGEQTAGPEERHMRVVRPRAVRSAASSDEAAREVEPGSGGAENARPAAGPLSGFFSWLILCVVFWMGFPRLELAPPEVSDDAPAVLTFAASVAARVPHLVLVMAGAAVVTYLLQAFLLGGRRRG
ncbi:hypothetical protein [Cellulomonas denverensis]|uniref:Uncharacterized protein n=1 Tax=Cellulomonas denverensis TaxID=264297 RepID=A0A7X6KYA4_9CELL|nr:hypothetical protein [Cellulomonas denverensis]NKY24317.1 hypothetical protein [Cellulomonas denverensis]